MLVGVLAAFRFAILTHGESDLRHRREMRRPHARELRQRPAGAEHLVNLPSARRQGGIARSEGLKAVIYADQSHFAAIAGGVEQRAGGGKVMRCR